MAPRAIGAFLALAAAVMFVVAIAVQAWWAGNPAVEGRTITAKTVAIGLVSATGCNVGGDGTCEDLKLDDTIAIIRYAELAAMALAGLLALILVFTALRISDARKVLATTAMAATGLAAIGGVALLVLGPGIAASQRVAVPIGWPVFLFGGAIVTSLLAAVVTRKLEPEPLRLKTIRASQARLAAKPKPKPQPAPKPAAQPAPQKPAAQPAVGAPAQPAPPIVPSVSPPRANSVDDLAFAQSTVPNAVPITDEMLRTRPPAATQDAAPIADAPPVRPSEPRAARPSQPPPRPSEPRTGRPSEPPPTPPARPSEPRAKPPSMPPLPGAKPVVVPPIIPPIPPRSAKQTKPPPAPAPTSSPPTRTKKPTVPMPEKRKQHPTLPNSVPPPPDRRAATEAEARTTVEIDAEAKARAQMQMDLEPTEIGVEIPRGPSTDQISASVAASSAAEPNGSPAHDAKRQPAEGAQHDESAKPAEPVEVKPAEPAPASPPDEPAPATPPDEPAPATPPDEPAPPPDDSAPRMPADRLSRPSATYIGPVPREHDASSAPREKPEADASQPASRDSAIAISTARTDLPPPRKIQGGGPTPACPQCATPMSWVDEHLRFYCRECKTYF